MEELVLAVILDGHLAIELLQTTLEASENALDDHATALNFLEAPLDLEHSPVLLNAEGCKTFLLSVLFRFSKVILGKICSKRVLALMKIDWFGQMQILLTSSVRSSFESYRGAVTLCAVRTVPLLQFKKIKLYTTQF